MCVQEPTHLLVIRIEVGPIRQITVFLQLVEVQTIHHHLPLEAPIIVLLLEAAPALPEVQAVVQVDVLVQEEEEEANP